MKINNVPACGESHHHSLVRKTRRVALLVFAKDTRQARLRCCSRWWTSDSIALQGLKICSIYLTNLPALVRRIPLRLDIARKHLMTWK